MRAHQPCLICLLLLTLVSCGGNASPQLPQQQEIRRNGPSPSQEAGIPFPQDGVQPWEQTDGNGFVIPGNVRGGSALGPDSEFQPGIERFLEGGGFSDQGEATRLVSPTGGPVAWAMYRLPLGGAQPGVVTVDANLLSPASEYYVAVADYGLQRWQWHGPSREAQVIVDVNGTNRLSPFGNTFVLVAAYNGAQIDVVGVGVAPRDAADSAAPPVPTAPTLTPVAGGLELSWQPVIAMDLAGYRIHYSDFPFSDLNAPSVKTLPFLENTTRYVLPRAPRQTYVALSAVDISGNASSLSARSQARPLNGSLPELGLSVSQVSGKLNDTIMITASGASSFDFDLDGDGIFDITDTAIVLAQVDTSRTGIIRPRVRGTDGGSAVAMGSVSLVIVGNQRPVASITTLHPTSGEEPLDVTLSSNQSTDFDGTIVEWAWDYSSDGIYDYVVADDLDNPVTFAVGSFNVRLRVTDNDGAWDVDSMHILSTAPELTLFYEPTWQVGVPALIYPFYAGSSSVTAVEWDLDANGSVDFTLPYNEPLRLTPMTAGVLQIRARALLSSGAEAWALALVTAHGWLVSEDCAPSNNCAYLTGASCAEMPALAYVDGGGEALFLRATEPSGSTWAAPLALSPPGVQTSNTAMIRLANGRVGVAYLDLTNGDLCYTYAMSDDGTLWSSPVVLEAFGISVSNVSIALIGGNPAVAYYHNVLKDPLYVRALDAEGSSWGSVIDISGTAHDRGRCISLAEINGRPAVVYVSDGTDLYYARASDATGSSWPASLQMRSIDMNGHDIPLSLAQVDGRPALACTNVVANACLLQFIRADDSNGTAWSEPVLVASSELAMFFAPSLKVITGIPYITYIANIDSQYIAKANTESGSGWNTSSVMNASVVSADTSTAHFAVADKQCIAQTAGLTNRINFAVYY